ncbi:MAG TPA: MAPEG family protein [Steroidobacteraceae bacterium]|nr:MAPEG family protein [Steroidobacteraceae bacterium]
MAIVWPAFALVALTLLSVARLARMRFAAARSGRVDPRYYKVFKGEGEPPELAATSRNVANLYEMPTLFYAGTAIAFAAGESGGLLVGLGWAYVVLRAAHSAIHVTSNKVLWRFRAFFASWVVLFAYWAVLGAAIARGPAAG